MPYQIDPSVFRPEAISSETKLFNDKIIETFNTLPDMWEFTPELVRQAREQGAGIFPIEASEPTAKTVKLESPWGAIPLRVFSPRAGSSKGSYLHFHGGGWMLGAATGQDERLQEIADNCSLNCISVDYRLAPEQPYPAGPDDCEFVANWLVSGDHKFNDNFLAIGGESAGAHLAALTLLRLRDQNSSCPFHAAVLSAGVYDLGKTASVRNWGDEKLILNTRDMELFVTNFLQHGEDFHDATISPLYAKLDNLPPALFSVGTRDLLLDDSIMMATRWQCENGNAQLDVTAGGCHVFQSFRHLKISQSSNAKMDGFLNHQRQIRNKLRHE